MSIKQRKIIVVGGGPAGIFAAWCLSGAYEVHLFEQSSSLGRKILIAGKGGLNITNHSIQKIREAYTPAGFMDQALDVLDNEALRNWLHSIGIPTYIGSSGKVFPQQGIKAIEVVQKMTNALVDRKVNIHLNHRLVGFTLQNVFTFEMTDPKVAIKIKHSADYCILALGGASWPQTGSDGMWVNMFNENGISTLSFQPSNCGINIEWPTNIRQFHVGKPLKNITIKLVNGEEEAITPAKVQMNEALITNDGLEGAAVYGIVPMLRSLFAAGNKAFISIDFKPQNTLDQLLKKIPGENPEIIDSFGKQSKSKVPDYKNLLSLQTEHMALIKAFTPPDILHSKEKFCQTVKNLIIPVHSLRPLKEAISGVGGISTNDINENFSLKSNSSIFVIGEMVNWDAPTGGYLLQGCFSMAALVAHSIVTS